MTQYRYTTVYVTHDQAEAMTTADQIAVMNSGRVEQLGSPQEIYDTPTSEFVARFLGASNIIKGVSLGAGCVSVAGVALRCAPRQPNAERRMRGRDPTTRYCEYRRRSRPAWRTCCRRRLCATSFLARAATIWLNLLTAPSFAS